MDNKPIQSGNQPPRANINVKLSDLTDISCEECESKYFRPVTLIKRLSPIVSPTGIEQMIPVQVFRCDECGHVNKDLMPK